LFFTRKLAMPEPALIAVDLQKGIAAPPRAFAREISARLGG